MFSFWSNDPTKIKEEITSLTREKRPVFYLDKKNKKLRPVSAERISYNGSELLLINKPWMAT